MRQYRRKKGTEVTAVRLDLDTEGFEYRRWGSTQRAKRGDWLVDFRGDVHTVDAGSFERTYRRVSPGVYEKIAPVWAERAETAGAIETKEGATAYAAGDYLVFNDPGGGDGYAMTGESFQSLYEACEE